MRQKTLCPKSSYTTIIESASNVANKMHGIGIVLEILANFIHFHDGLIAHQRGKTQNLNGFPYNQMCDALPA
eukprot:1874359-Pleurochrysis_carterae.AAC.3